MTQDTDDGELAALRRRAYGPDADIHLDPVALRRLRELEAKPTRPGGREAAPGVPGMAAEETGPAAADPRVAESDADVAEPLAERAADAHAPAAAAAGTPARRFRLAGRRAAIAAIAAACVIAAAGVAAGAALIPHGVRDVGRRVAVLAADPAYEVPAGLIGIWDDPTAHIETFEAFHGLRTVVGPSPVDDAQGKPSDDVCAFVYAENGVTRRTLDDNTTTTVATGAFFNGCSADDFPASVQFRVDDSVPRELQKAYAAGTGLQFDYDPRRHRVLVYASR